MARHSTVYLVTDTRGNARAHSTQAEATAYAERVAELTGEAHFLSTVEAVERGKPVSSDGAKPRTRKTSRA